MRQSRIPWTDFSGGDANFVLRGKDDCACSAGCENCYMATLDKRFHILPEQTTYYPEKLERLARHHFPQYSPKRGAPHKPMVFVVDGGDIFHERVPDEFIRRAFSIMAQRDDVVWQVLTKRPRRMQQVLFESDFYSYRQAIYGPPQHIWMGVTAENQETWDERVERLWRVWPGLCFVSIEPMLERIDNVLPYLHYGMIDWVILGAETGPKRRSFEVRWAEEVYEQCKMADVPFFFKQGRALLPGRDDILPGVGQVKQFPGGPA